MSDRITEQPFCQTSISGSYYLVRYYGGSYDDYYSAVVFVTNKKSTAIPLTIGILMQVSISKTLH